MISDTRAGAVSRLTFRKLMTPFGIPALDNLCLVAFANITTESTSCKASTTMEIDMGLTSEDFKITVFPQINGIATARTLRGPGAFHGVIASISREN